jgi:hypothetical protein
MSVDFPLAGFPEIQNIGAPLSNQLAKGEDQIQVNVLSVVSILASCCSLTHRVLKSRAFCKAIKSSVADMVKNDED